MKRRSFLKQAAMATTALAATLSPRSLLAAEEPRAAGGKPTLVLDAALRKDWLARWEKNILDDLRNRYCDKETGEELGWLVSPFLNGFYYGCLATRDPKWVEALIDWMDSCLKRSVKEPDGFTGWPKGDGGGGESKEYSADSLLGEAMMLRPVVLMAEVIRTTPALAAKWGEKAQSYVKLAEEIFQKWDSRDCWREAKGGGLWVVPAFGIDTQTGKWSAGYAARKTTGFSNPDNKENHIARWLLALYDATKKPVYRERAAGWFQLMKSRMRTRQDGKYFVWNYWEPAGPWDYKADGSPKHWVGVHPNGGYYGIDVEGIVAAFEHGLVFTREDVDRLIATNRDYMWNQQVAGAKFQRIDGEEPDPRWKNSPGVLWTALVPYDPTLRQIFLANHDPAGWGGLGATPWFLSLSK
jgi:hypothetical protein